MIAHNIVKLVFTELVSDEGLEPAYTIMYMSDQGINCNIYMGMAGMHTHTCTK